MQIDNKAFIVTGAASGLGAETARLLASAGGRVVLVDLNREQGERLADKLGPNARFVAADITDGNAAQEAIAAAREAFGEIRGLVNCAGVAPAEKLLGRKGVHRLESFSRVVTINLVGSFNMLRLAAAAMAENEADDGGERGVIVNTASVAAFDGQIGQAAYAASKGGIVAMTLPLARELASHGIRVMTIAPGIMETPMLLGMPEDVQRALGETVPFPARLGKPAEFAALVGHIVTNRYLNGEVIRLDGAIRMAAK
ncbi:MAG: SDR family NAD(P)-dependent oxidoreductase [Rhodocyclaceae bacterium]|nr:SDR family NAD(P)-dependent oxidoreductase [Rhodocyclaceae bacterium]